jgi:hypothetical protein
MCANGVVGFIQVAEAAMLALVAAVGSVAAAVAVLAPRIAQNKADVQAAWERLHVHEKVLSGPLRPPEGREGA